MSRASITIARNITYEYLNVRSGSYGSLDSTNQRYLTEFIDDNLIAADIETVALLIKNKQHNLLQEIMQTSGTITNASPIPNSWAVINVKVNSIDGIEVPQGLYNEIIAGGIFASSYSYYYCMVDGLIYSSANSAVVTYINLTHPTSLTAFKSPTGFESALADLATAKCLMKRSDRPEEAKWHMERYNEFMAKFLLPENVGQENFER